MGDGEIVKREGAGKRGEVEEEEKERRGRVKFVLSGKTSPTYTLIWKWFVFVFWHWQLCLSYYVRQQ